MLKLPPFNILRPRNRDELNAGITGCKDEFKFLGGGTDLINGMKKRLYPVSVLISLKRVESLGSISYDENCDQLKIGATTTLTELAASPALTNAQPAIAAAIASIAAPPIRNRATVGGNLCLDTRCYYYNQSQSWRKLAPACYKCGGEICNAAPGSKKCRAVFSADLPPLLIALEAEITIVGGSKTRTIPLADFYTGSGVKPNILQQDEYLLGITLNHLKNRNSLYRKFRLRKALDFPLAGVALAFDDNHNRKFVNPIIVLNAVASNPLVVSEAARQLDGKNFNDTDAIQAAAEAAMAAAKPIANIGSKPFYRKKMIGMLFKKMAAELAAGQEA